MIIRGWARHARVDWKSVIGPNIMRVQMDNLRYLLSEETLADINTQNRFEAWARGDHRDVRFEVDTLIASEMKGGFVPDYNGLYLHGIQSEIESVAEQDPETATLMYMGITEALGIHYEMIDDSSGDFWPLFEECVQALGDCIRQQNPSADERKQFIAYLAYWSQVVFSDFMEYYEKQLAELCTSTEDLYVWKGILETMLEKSYIDYRDCRWAVNKSQIKDSLTRVLEKIRTAGT